MVYFIDDLMRISNIQWIYIIIFVSTFILYRISLCVAVYGDAKERQLNHKAAWSVPALFFGFISAVIYLLVNYRKKDVLYVNYRKIFIILSIVFIIISINFYFIYGLSNTGEFGMIFDPQ